MPWILDMTRAHAGSEAAVVELARGLDGSPDGEVTAVFLTSQGAAATNLGLPFRTIDRATGDDSGIASDISGIVQSISQEGKPVRIVTHRGIVRSFFEGAAKFDPRISVSNFPKAPLGEPPWPQGFSKAAAAQLVAEVVRKAGSAVRQTDLRAYLASADPAYRKTPGSAASQPRFIGAIVDEAVARGLIELSGGENDNNPWITAAPTASARAGDTTIAVRAPAQTPDTGLSGEYISTLRALRFGPFQEVRMQVYDALEALVKTGPRDAKSLVREAISEVSTSFSSDFEARRGKPFPWARLRIFIIRLLNESVVLRGGKKAVRHSLSDSSTIVDGLAENWRYEMDALLVEALLDSDCEISEYSVDELAGALYNGRSGAEVDHALALLSHMFKMGRIAEDPVRHGRLIRPALQQGAEG